MDKEIKKTTEAGAEKASFDQEIIEIIHSEKPDQVIREELDNYHENDIAGVLEKLDPDTRKRLYRILGLEMVSEIFTYLDDVSEFLEEMGLETAADVLEEMDADDAVDALEDVDEDTREQLISRMDQESKEDIRLISSYDEDQIGSRMTTNYIMIEKDFSVKKAMRSLIEQAEENDNISTIYVKDEAGKYYGAIELKDLITAREYTELDTIISTSYPYVLDTEKVSDCIERLKDYGEDSIPVLNQEEVILGVITSDDIVEAVDDELGDDYAKLAGLTAEADIHESLGESLKKRMPWLLLLMALGVGVSTVVGAFEGLVAQFALIVSFQSLILDMAGNVGTQSLAVTIRVLMDENVSAKEKMLLVLKEMRIGLTNGLILGVLGFCFIGIYVWLVKGRSLMYAFAISGCVGLSLAASMLISGMVGTLVPLFFHKIKVDPAVASGPLITTVNDLVAVIIYYGLSGFILIHIMNLI